MTDDQRRNWFKHLPQRYQRQTTPEAFHAYLDRAYDDADPDEEFSPMDLPCYAADALGIEDVDERVAFCLEYFAAYAGQARADHIRLMLGFDKLN